MIEKTESYAVFSSNPRLMFGHTLVIPRKHVGAIYDLPENEWVDLFRVALRIQKKIAERYTIFTGKVAACELACHPRPFMPTTEVSVPLHAHFHLRPRTLCDEYYEEVLKYETDVFKRGWLTEDEKVRYRELLLD